MEKRTFIILTAFVISLMALSFYAGKMVTRIDNINAMLEYVARDTMTDITPTPNQGRIPDTTINGIDYYKAN